MSQSAKTPAIYLAGPDVFLENSEEIGLMKGRICRALRLEPIYPGDTEIVKRTDLDDAAKAQAIYDENIAHIRRADGVIANLSPFRGPCADDGTAFEVGYAMALGLPVTAYDNGGGSVKAKTLALRGRGGAVSEDPYDVIEDFGHPSNLMLACSVAEPIVSGDDAISPTAMARFEAAARAMARMLGERG